MKSTVKKSNEEFIKELKEKKIEYKPLEKYDGASKKILFQCNQCGNIWGAKPTNILSGRGCPKCRDIEARRRWIYSHDKFCELANEKNPNYSDSDFVDMVEKNKALINVPSNFKPRNI